MLNDQRFDADSHDRQRVRLDGVAVQGAGQLWDDRPGVGLLNLSSPLLISQCPHIGVLVCGADCLCSMGLHPGCVRACGGCRW